MVKCIVEGCERTLRTGRKYCYIHRSLGKKISWIDSRNLAHHEASLEFILFIAAGFAIMGFLYLIGWIFSKIWIWLFIIFIGFLLIFTLLKINEIKNKKKISEYDFKDKTNNQ